MAHDSHFLKRLSRASLPQAELALTLYHDAALVREVFALAALPEQVERVALCLDREEHGPYVVLARSGRFVTCLARNMTTGDTPVLPYATLEQAAARIEQLRARIRLEETLDEEKLRVRQLIRRLCRAADEVSREEIEALLPFQPILGLSLYLEALELGTRVLDLRDDLLPRTRLSARTQDHQALQLYHQALWGCSHLITMACADSLDWTERVSQSLNATPGTLSWAQVGSGFLPAVMRGIWAVARMGKLVLPAYKRAWTEAASMKSLLNGGLGLLAIGFRHGKLASEVTKCLQQRSPILADEPDATALNSYLDYLQANFRYVCAAYELHRLDYPRLVAEAGARLMVSYCKQIPSRDGAHHYKDPAEVPEALGRYRLVNEPVGLLQEPQLLRTIVLPIPWLARCRLEELYAPQSFLTSYHCAWAPELSMQILNDQRPVTSTPIRQPRTPGRNDPCSCGSGKKYKKCCGE